jgi:hypothetical protein
VALKPKPKVMKMANVKHIAFYTNVMNQWGKADLGPKVTEAQLALAHVFGKPGKQSLVVAMALRADGVTRGQMLGAAALFDGKPTPQLNHMRALVNAKLLTRQPVPGAYVLVKGPKADQYIDLHGAKAATAVEAPKAKKASKPRKAKVTAPVIEAPAVTEPAPAELTA